VFTAPGGRPAGLLPLASPPLGVGRSRRRRAGRRLPRPAPGQQATALVAAGVDIKTAQSRLGHSDPRLTLAAYARAVPEADRAAAELLGARFFGTPPRPRSVLPG
ncbi:MAG: hypothetical protein M0Z95_26575, partial [Actinomycetota bacterium]|nr:hypothetical protein [Actinomycetota bacterium]